MSTVAAPVRRTRAASPPSGRARSAPRRTPAHAPARSRPRARPQAAPAAPTRARAGVAAALVVVFVLVSAVLFHVGLAQGQLELDRLDSRIAAERAEYERLRYEVSTLSSPQRIIEEAEKLGLVIPDEPRIYIEVPGAKVPATRSANPSTTIGEWEDVKPHLGDTGP